MEAFGARQTRRYDMPDSSIMHAEVQIDDTVVMVSDGTDDNPPVPIWLHVYVPDVDASYRRASTPVVSPSMSRKKGKVIPTAASG